MSKDHSTFLDDWLKDPEFSGWVPKVPNDSLSAKCKFCKKTFTLSNMGRQALVSHAIGKKHLKNVHSISTFFKSSNSSKSSSQPPAKNVPKQGTRIYMFQILKIPRLKSLKIVMRFLKNIK